jgi:hypothetical protein
MMQTGYQQATQAYNVVGNSAADSHTVMLKSLQYMVRKLNEAKGLRGEKDFEGVFNCHERIYRVISVLENGLPDPSMVEDEALKNASLFLKGFYVTLRSDIRAIGAKEDWDARYAKIADAVKGLHGHLFKHTPNTVTGAAGAALPTNAANVGSVDMMN